MKTAAKRPKKSDLPTKICAACGRPFTWRKKWERDWETVRYCSERCRREKQSAPATEGALSRPKVKGERR